MSAYNGRPKKEKFRYQKINFNSESEEEELMKALGPSKETSMTKKKKCRKLLRLSCIFFFVSALIVGVVSLIVFGDKLFPEDDRFNSTSADFEDGITTVIMGNVTYETASTPMFTTVIDKNGTEEVIQDGTENTMEVIEEDPDGDIEIDEYVSYEESDDDSTAKTTEKSTTSEGEDNDIKPTEGSSEELSKTEATTADESRRQKRSADENPLQSAKQSVNPMEEVIDQIEAELTPTTSVTAAISPEPRKATDLEEEEAAPKPTPSNNINNLSTTDRDIERLNQTDVYWSLDTLVRTWTTTGEMLKKNIEPDSAIIIGIVVGSSVLILLIIFLLYRLVQVRKRRKREHFARLVNDLNATEKFSIIADSDDESE